MNLKEQKDFAFSLAKRKLSLDSTNTSFKSKKGTFRKEYSSPKRSNQLLNKFINTAFKNNMDINKSRNIIAGNLPICISQLTNLKNFNELSTKFTQKEIKNSSLNNISSIDNDNTFNFHSNSRKKNNNFKKLISRNGKFLVINDLLNSFNTKFEKNGNGNNCTKNILTPEKEKSSLLLKLSPFRLKPNLRITSFVQSPIGSIKYKIRDIENKAFLNRSNINNNSSTLENNLSDINIIINKTNIKNDKNISSFDLCGNNLSSLGGTNNNSINNTIDIKRNNNKKHFSGLNFSFRKLKDLKHSNYNSKINKNLFLCMNNNIFEDKRNISNKNNIKPINKLIINNININKNKIINFHSKKSSDYNEKVINEIKKIIIQKDKENNNDVEKSFLNEKKIIQKNEIKINDISRNFSAIKKNNISTFKDIEQYENNVELNENQNLDENEKKSNNLQKKDNKDKKGKKSIKSAKILENKGIKTDKNAYLENTEKKIGIKMANLKNENIKLKLVQALSKNVLRIKRKNSIKIGDYFNKNKKEYSHLIIPPKSKKLEKNKFLNKLNKKLENNNALNNKLFNSKAVILLLNSKKKELYFSKKYNQYKDNIKNNIQNEGLNSLNIKVFNKYNNAIEDELNNKRDLILEYKNKYTKCNHDCGTEKSIFKYFCDKYEFEGIDSLKTKKNNKSRRNSIVLSLEQINKILEYKMTKKKDNFPLLKSKAFFMNNEVDWKNTKTNFMYIHKFILREHLFDLNDENTKYYSKRHNTDKHCTCSSHRSLSSFKNGLGSLLKNSGIIQFSPPKKRNLFRRTSSFIDLTSIHRRNSIKLEEKKKNNMNNYSILSSKKIFYNNNQKNGKYSRNEYLLNIKEVDDDDYRESEKEENTINEEKSKKELPFILQLDENNCKIKNKGEFLLKNYRTIEDIYLGLCFLIVEGKEKLFINKMEEMKELIDIDNQIFDGNTFLILATREGNKNLVKFLCENKCEMNLQNDKGNTALHYAIGNLFFDIVDILISYGAKEDILNCKGLRPWDCIDKYLE